MGSGAGKCAAPLVKIECGEWSIECGELRVESGVIKWKIDSGKFRLIFACGKNN